MICCREKETNRGRQLRHLIKRIGVQELSYQYDLVKGPGQGVYQSDPGSTDTLFFYGDLIAGVLPDTSEYFGIIHYQVGDMLYPFVSTFEKSGNLIARKRIGVGACGGLTIDIDTCVDQVTINKNLEIESVYKVIGIAEDSTGQEIRICNQIKGKGKITSKGRIEYSETEIIDCN